MTTTTHYCLLLFVMTIILITTTGRSTMGSQQKTIYEVLKSNELPSGLLPKGITNFTVDDNGGFQVYLDQPCTAKFESELHYEKNVAGQLSIGQIGNLSGISAQDLFLWFPVKGIRVDVPSSGVIYFDVGVVHKQFSVSSFEDPKDCQVLFDSTNIIARVLTKKLGGILRYSANWWWKNAGEIM